MEPNLVEDPGTRTAARRRWLPCRGWARHHRRLETWTADGRGPRLPGRRPSCAWPTREAQRRRDPRAGWPHAPLEAAGEGGAAGPRPGTGRGGGQGGAAAAGGEGEAGSGRRRCRCACRGEPPPRVGRVCRGGAAAARWSRLQPAPAQGAGARAGDRRPWGGQGRWPGAGAGGRPARARLLAKGGAEGGGRRWARAGSEGAGGRWCASVPWSGSGPRARSSGGVEAPVADRRTAVAGLVGCGLAGVEAAGARGWGMREWRGCRWRLRGSARARVQDGLFYILGCYWAIGLLVGLRLVRLTEPKNRTNRSISVPQNQEPN